MIGKRGVGLGFWWGAALSSCTWLVEADRPQCVTDADCLGLTPSSAPLSCVQSVCSPLIDPSWSCLDEPPVAAERGADRVRLIVPLLDAVSGDPAVGVPVRICERLDADCLMPVAEVASDERGEVDLLLEPGFDGYLRWEAPGLRPTLFFMSRPLVRDSIVSVNVIRAEVVEALDDQLRIEELEDRAIGVAFVKDCLGAPASGVSVSSPDADPETRVLYAVDGLFTDNATSTGVAGLARLVNLPLGAVEVQAALPDGSPVASTTVLTRAGFSTLVNLYPNVSLPR